VTASAGGDSLASAQTLRGGPAGQEESTALQPPQPSPGARRRKKRRSDVGGGLLQVAEEVDTLTGKTETPALELKRKKRKSKSTKKALLVLAAARRDVVADLLAAEPSLPRALRRRR